MTFFFFLPSILLSGFMFPFRGMPDGRNGWAPRCRSPTSSCSCAGSCSRAAAFSTCGRRSADTRLHAGRHRHRAALLQPDAGLNHAFPTAPRLERARRDARSTGGSSAIVLAIPAGGVPVGAAIARELDLSPTRRASEQSALSLDDRKRLRRGRFRRQRMDRQAAVEGSGLTSSQVEKATADARTKVERRSRKLFSGNALRDPLRQVCNPGRRWHSGWVHHEDRDRRVAQARRGSRCCRGAHCARALARAMPSLPTRSYAQTFAAARRSPWRTRAGMA